MKEFLKKITSSIMLTAFLVSNSTLVSVAMEDFSGVYNAPDIRQSADDGILKLKADVSFSETDTPVSISLRDSDVKQVLRMFADKAGKNIIFHDSVEGTITLDLVDVPLNSAFDMIIEMKELNYVVQDNTIMVAKAGAGNLNMAKQAITAIPVKYISASALAEFVNKNIFAMKKAGLSDSDIVVTNPATNELLVFGTNNDVAIVKKVVEKFDKKPTTTTFKVNHTTPAEMADMICQMLLPASGAGKAGGAATGGAAGIMTGAAADEGGGGGALALNAGTVACTVDGKTGGSLASLGLQNLAVSYYSGLGTINVVGGSEQQIEMIRDFIAHTDKKQPQAYLEVSIIELNEEGSKELSNTWNIFSKSFSASFDGTTTSTHPLYPIFFKGNDYSVGSLQQDSGWKENYTAGKYSGPLTIAYAINYLIQSGKARIVVNPRIVITNGEESKIEVTQDYLESVEVDSSTSTGGTVITRDYTIGEDQGVTVAITPFISPDGYVTLNIVPEYSTEVGQVDGSEEIDGKRVPYKAATLLSHRNLDLKNIRIKDGETLVIAGMIQERETKTVHKIPVLGDLPLIGAMFRSSTNSKSKSEMVMMLTPKIISDNEDAATDAL